MTRNEGYIVRVVRVIIGLAILSLVFIGPKTLFGLVGLVPLITGLAGYCPVYGLFNFRTCPLSNSPIDDD